MNDSPHDSQHPGAKADSSTDQPVWIRHLSEDDAQALDALLAAVNRDDQVGLAQQRDPERTRRVQALLGLLDYLPEHEDDPRRVQRTLEAVRAQQQRQRFLVAQHEMGPAVEPGFGFGWRHIGMVAVAVTLAFSLLLPVLEHNRAEAERLACASNLRVAGMGFNQYAQDHDGVLPRGRVQPGAPWWHVGEIPSERDAVDRSNSAHLYLLVRGGGYVDADDLACPTNPHAPIGEMTWQHHDWRSPEEVSYSYQNQYTERPWRMDRQAHMAVLADKNPLFVARQGRVIFDDQTPFDAPSRAHNRRGQNVLLLDGRVSWTVSPVLRQPGQFGQTNIWVAEGVERYTGTELPGSREDSFLVP